MIVYGGSSKDDPPRRVGIAHFDMSPHEVGIIVGEKTLWGHGVATAALKTLVGRVAFRPLIAVIHPKNVGSQRAFAAVGFKNTREPARGEQELWLLK